MDKDRHWCRIIAHRYLKPLKVFRVLAVGTAVVVVTVVRSNKKRKLCSEQDAVTNSFLRCMYHYLKVAKASVEIVVEVSGDNL